MGFADDTAVTPLGDGRFTATVIPEYGVIGGAPNGGFLMVLGTRAMAAVCDRPDPVTVTAHFLRPPSHGPITIETEVLRPGGRHATVTARLVQDGTECVHLVGSFADLSRAEGATDVRRTPPDRPGPDELPDPLALVADAPAGAMEPPALFRRIDLRAGPSTFGWAVGQPDGTGVVHAWCRLPDGEELDSHALVFLADVLPPAVLNLGGPAGWVPTMELTVHVRRRPPAGWVNAEFRTSALTEGYAEEDGELWSADGELLAISRQSALAPRPS